MKKNNNENDNKKIERKSSAANSEKSAQSIRSIKEEEKIKSTMLQINVESKNSDNQDVKEKDQGSILEFELSKQDEEFLKKLASKLENLDVKCFYI